MRPTLRSRTGRPSLCSFRSAGFRSTWSYSPQGFPGRQGHPCRRWALTPPFHHHPFRVSFDGRSRSGRGCLVSVALSVRQDLLPPAFFWEKCGALCCPDFPLPGLRQTAMERFAFSQRYPNQRMDIKNPRSCGGLYEAYHHYCFINFTVVCCSPMKRCRK